MNMMTMTMVYLDSEDLHNIFFKDVLEQHIYSSITCRDERVK